MDSKKEMLAASLLAIALAAGLGTVSYGLFAQTTPNARVDIFSKKNGATSTSFLPSDQVSLEAQVSYDDALFAGAPVTFEVKMPNTTELISQTVQTDSHGIADLTFQIPWPTNDSLGIWQAKAMGQIYGQTLNATTHFSCELMLPTIDIYTQKGGFGQNTPGGTFTTNETVMLYAEIRDAFNHSVSSNYLVGFELKYYNTTSLLWTATVQPTNASGIAAASTRLPPDPAYALTWEAYATAQYDGSVIIDTLTFTAKNP